MLLQLKRASGLNNPSRLPGSAGFEATSIVQVQTADVFELGFERSYELGFKRFHRCTVLRFSQDLSAIPCLDRHESPLVYIYIWGERGQCLISILKFRYPLLNLQELAVRCRGSKPPVSLEDGAKTGGSRRPGSCLDKRGSLLVHT